MAMLRASPKSRGLRGGPPTAPAHALLPPSPSNEDLLDPNQKTITISLRQHRTKIPLIFNTEAFTEQYGGFPMLGHVALWLQQNASRTKLRGDFTAKERIIFLIDDAIVTDERMPMVEGLIVEVRLGKRGRDASPVRRRCARAVEDTQAADEASQVPEDIQMVGDEAGDASKTSEDIQAAGGTNLVNSADLLQALLVRNINNDAELACARKLRHNAFQQRKYHSGKPQKTKSINDTLKILAKRIDDYIAKQKAEKRDQFNEKTSEAVAMFEEAAGLMAQAFELSLAAGSRAAADAYTE